MDTSRNIPKLVLKLKLLMKYLLLSLLFVLPSKAVHLQNNHKGITIDIVDFQMKGWQTFSQMFQTSNPYTNNNEQKGDLLFIQHYITSIIAKNKRFTLQEYSSFKIVNNEWELQKKEDFIDGKIVRKKNVEPSEYLLSGILSRVNNQIELAVYYVPEGKIIAKKMIHLYPKAINKWNRRKQIKESLNKAVKAFLNAAFPQQYPLVEIEKGTKKATRVLMAIGADNDIKKKMFLQLYSNEQKIGLVKIKEVQGKHFSSCKVIEGGEAIARAYRHQEKIYGLVFLEDN